MTFPIFAAFVDGSSDKPVIYCIAEQKAYENFKSYYKLDFLPNDPFYDIRSDDEIVYYKLVESPWYATALLTSTDGDKLNTVLTGVRIGFAVMVAKEQEKREHIFRN